MDATAKNILRIYYPNFLSSLRVEFTVALAVLYPALRTGVTVKSEPVGLVVLRHVVRVLVSVTLDYGFLHGFLRNNLVPEGA
jgi:hypothetical protein